MGHVDASQVPELGGDLPPRHALVPPVGHQFLERACITEEPIGCRVEGGLGHVAIMGSPSSAVKSQTGVLTGGVSGSKMSADRTPRIQGAP